MRSTLDNQLTVGERFEEMDRFFTGNGRIHTTLLRLAADFRHLDIHYAVIGAMALNAHGYHRETTNIDVLVTREGFESFGTQSPDLGFAAIAQGARRAFQHADTGVVVDFFLSGEFPGDGKPKPVAFPDPATVAVDFEGINFVDLPTLINLKLASGMTRPDRLRDLADMQDLVRVLRLPDSFSNGLSPYVRTTFLELAEQSRQPDAHVEEPQS